MNNTPAVQKKELTIKDQIESNKNMFLEILPKHCNIDRFVKSAAIAVWNNEKVKACSKESIIAAIYNAAELGLDFTPAKGHACLVSFKGEAKFMPQYRGLLELVRRSGIVENIEAHVVYGNEEFEIEYGTNSHLIHKPLIIGERGGIIGAYAVAFFKTGQRIFDFMTLADLEKVRKHSIRAKEGAWIEWTEEMYKKTVLRRLYKMLPSSPDLDRAFEHENEFYDVNKPPAPDLQPPKEERKRGRKPKGGIPENITDGEIEETSTQLAKPSEEREDLFEKS